MKIFPTLGDFSYQGRFFLPWEIFFLSWEIFLIMRYFSYHGIFFSIMGDFSYHERFFLPWEIFLSWVIFFYHRAIFPIMGDFSYHGRFFIPSGDHIAIGQLRLHLRALDAVSKRDFIH